MANNKASLTGSFSYELRDENGPEIVGGTATFDGAGKISYTRLDSPNATYQDGYYDVYPDGTGMLMMHLSDGRGPGAGPFFRFVESGGFSKLRLIPDVGVPRPFSGEMERA